MSGRPWFSIRRLAVVSGAVVVIACLAAAAPTAIPHGVFLAVLLGGAALWTLGTLLPDRLHAARVACFVAFGLVGGALDLVQPWGSGLVAGFMAVAALALALPARPAAALALPVLGVVGGAEAITSEHPWSAALNVALGLGFFFAAARFAAINREASARAERMLEQEAALRQARDEAAALCERARLARELHDVLAHTLSGLSLQLEAAGLLAARTGADPRLLEQVELAQRTARAGVLDGKRAIAALRGRPIAGLADLDTLVADARRDGGIPIEVSATGAERPLTAEQGLAVYRTVQEALSNIRRHAAGATRVEVGIAWRPERVVVRIADHGSPAATPSGLVAGFGLTGLAERATALGGRFQAGPTDDGHAVELDLPLTVVEPVPGGEP